MYAMSDEALIGGPTWPRLATIGNDIVPPFQLRAYVLYVSRKRGREKSTRSR